MFSTKKIFAAAAVAMISVAGIASANAASWDHRNHRQEIRHDRHALHHDRVDRRAYVNRLRVADTLRRHHYRVIGDPYFVRDRYVVRTHDRFGRVVFVQVNPYTGAFIRTVRL